MTDIVESCPKNLIETTAASARLNCGKDQYRNDEYMCVPNTKKTGLVEYCHKGGIPLVIDGNCLETEGGQLYYGYCQQFTTGCPSEPYLANEIYKYPDCQNINAENQCYFADPSCPNTTRFTTNYKTEISSTYSDFPNTTSSTLYNKTPSSEDVPIDTGAIVGGVIGGVFGVVVIVMIVVYVVFRRKRQGNHGGRTDEESQPLNPIKELTDRCEESLPFPAVSTKNEDEDDVSNALEKDRESSTSVHSSSKPDSTRTFQILSGPCTEQFRDILHKHIPLSTFQQVIAQGENEKKLFRLNAAERKLILPTHGKYSGTYGDMDIPLIYKLLRNICRIPPHSKGWGKEPDSSDRSLSANIERIRIARNKCVHSSSQYISNWNFNSLWSEVRSAVVDLDSFLSNGNMYEKQVDSLMQDSGREHRYWKEQKASEDREARETIQSLKYQVGNLKSKVKKQKDQVGNLKSKVKKQKDQMEKMKRILKKHDDKFEKMESIFKKHGGQLEKMLNKQEERDNQFEGDARYTIERTYTEEEGFNELHEACRNGKLGICKHLIKTKPDLLHSVDDNGWNAALHAAKGGNTRIIQLLADNNIDVKYKTNAGLNIFDLACNNSNLDMSRYIIQTYPDLLHNVDNDGWNAALHAASGGNVEILILLAENGVDVKHKDNDGWNILHVACLNANLEMSRYIIQTYSDLLHNVDDDGRNAVLHAAGGRNVEILKLLVENEVDVKLQAKNDWNILNMACLNAELEMSRYLIQTYPDLLHNVDNDGWNAALHAARGGNVNILKLLAEKKVDVKQKDNDGSNILHVACWNANLEISRYIIQTYSDLLHNVDNDGWNAALHAARGGNVEILKLLVENEVDVKHKDNDGSNILNKACDNAKLEMSRYIIQTYPDLLHNVDNDGWNAALNAAAGGNIKMLQLLADNEVDVKHKSNNGRDILNAACANNSKLEMSCYIIQTYPELLHSVDNEGRNAALHAARGGNVGILKLLADHKVDIKHKDEEGLNIFHLACVNSNLEMSRYIIQTYPDLLHSLSNDGRNAALHAAKGGTVEILQLLSDKEVNVKQKDAKGLNILHLAVLESKLEMSRYIIQTYPDLLQSEDIDGRNAASIASQGGNAEISELLAKHGVYT